MKRTGADKVIIPRYNGGTKSAKWVIDQTILLPSDITVVLDNCYLTMADDTYCQMFATENLFDENGRYTDIHDCTIRNVKGFSNMCVIVRLLNQHGNKIYNISISDIFDAAIPKFESKTQMVLRIGVDAYYESFTERAKPGDMYNNSRVLGKF